MTDEPGEDELFEKLAAIEHERWAHWQKWVQGTQGVNTPRHTWDKEGNLTIPAVLIKAWRRQIDTPYTELSENEKQSDRDQVMRYWPLIQQLLAQTAAAARLDEVSRALTAYDPSQPSYVLNGNYPLTVGTVGAYYE